MTNGEREARQSLTLRSARVEDSELLLELNRRATLAAYKHIFPPDRYPFPEADVRRKRLALLQSSNHHFLIAERRGVAVGFACYSPGSLDEVYVVPEEWGQGASELLHAEAVIGADTGEMPIRLWVLADNERARRFYEKRGWRTDGREGRAEHPPYPRLLGYTFSLPPSRPSGGSEGEGRGQSAEYQQGVRDRSR